MNPNTPDSDKPSGSKDAQEPLPLKKRRVTRACDECRRKKIRCDAESPCSHCAAYGYTCTYNQPSLRRKAMQLKSFQEIEKRLQSYELIIHALIPDLDLDSPDFDLKHVLNQIRRILSQFDEHLLDKSLKEWARVMNLNLDTINMQPTTIPFLTELYSMLPPKAHCLYLVDVAFTQAMALTTVFHIPSFLDSVEQIYATSPSEFTAKKQQFLTVLISTLSVGILFADTPLDSAIKYDKSQAYDFYLAAKRVLDFKGPRGFHTMKAVLSLLMMLTYLFSTTRLSECYTFSGIALRAALSIGLHRRVLNKFSSVELEVRKRLFWSLRKLDIYSGAITGLPTGLRLRDITQDIPLDIEDKYLTDNGVLPHTKTISPISFSLVHNRLIEILGHTVTTVYPTKPSTMEQSGMHRIKYSQIAHIERELRDWVQSLPEELKPNMQNPCEHGMNQGLLYLSYCHVRLFLYRPFIHYVSASRTNTTATEYMCAMNCVNCARIVMNIADVLSAKDMLNPHYWFTIYTIFFAVTCLVYYSSENLGHPSAFIVRKDAEIGKNILGKFRKHSTPAARNYLIVVKLFEKLDKRMANV
ncbi:hypothetical protein CANCADRAFT_148272, partial [Tortispora caseinolytica NRRL Y-17796]